VTRKMKLTVAAVMTAVVATMGVSTAALADAGAVDARDRSTCC